MAEHEAIHIMGAGLSGLAAATILAKAGKTVHVHDIREDSGARFDGDFQALENWSMDVDFFSQLDSWGFDTSEFKATEFKVVDLIHPDDVITQAESPKIAYRIVERGTSSHTIDQGIKRQAIAAGAQIHYKSRVKEEDCHIIACGPKGTSAVAYGEIFHTDHPNHIAFQLNDKLAPGAYSYLIIIDGVGLICTCLWRKQKKSDRFLNETIAWYDKHYPNLNRKPIKRVGGKGDFSIPNKYVSEGRYYVGEAGGLQDFMWGFGMRYAITSGVLAGKSILGELDYEQEVRKRLLPLVKSSATNRFLMNRMGDRGFKAVARYWMRDQHRTGDGLRFMRLIYKPGILRRMMWPFVRLGMLRKGTTPDGRSYVRMPFRRALKRDDWEPSREAELVALEWKMKQNEGGRTSFQAGD